MKALFHKRTGRRGVMLLEVMLAVGIFALAGVALVTALNRLAETYTEARRIGHIRLELASRLDEARVLPISVSRKKTEPDAQGVTYEKEEAILPIQNDDKTPVPGLWRITVTARWLTGVTDQQEQAEIYVYQP